MMYQNNSSEMNLNRNDMGSGNTNCIRRFGHSEKQAVLYTISAVMMLLIGIYMLILNNSATNNMFNVARTPWGYMSADSGTWALCAFALLGGVTMLIQALGLRKHSLTVTAEGISGMSGGKTMLFAESFSLTWDQIRDVKKFYSNQLKLWGPEGKRIVCLDNHLEAEKLIRKLLQEYRSTGTVQSVGPAGPNQY